MTNEELAKLLLPESVRHNIGLIRPELCASLVLNAYELGKTQGILEGIEKAQAVIRNSSDESCNAGPMGPRQFASEIASLLDTDESTDDWEDRFRKIRVMFDYYRIKTRNSPVVPSTTIQKCRYKHGLLQCQLEENHDGPHYGGDVAKLVVHRSTTKTPKHRKPKKE